MSYRGRGRGRGRGGSFGFRPAKQVSFELFPEIEGLGKAGYSTEHLQLIQWGHELQKFWKNSPYCVTDSSQEDEGRDQLSYIERYSDRKSQATKVNSSLSDYMEMGPGYLPAELAIGGKKGKRKRVRWHVESDLKEQDVFEKLLRKDQEQQGDDKKEDENEEEDEEDNEDGEEYSDEGDYEQGEYFDDDEDEYNMPESDDEGPIY